MGEEKWQGDEMPRRQAKNSRHDFMHGLFGKELVELVQEFDRKVIVYRCYRQVRGSYAKRAAAIRPFIRKGSMARHSSKWRLQ